MLAAAVEAAIEAAPVICVVYIPEQNRGGPTAGCDVQECRYRMPIEVAGGDAEFRTETERMLDRHRREAHPWLFAEMTTLPYEALHSCTWCGAAVADPDAHLRWHRTAQA